MRRFCLRRAGSLQRCAFCRLAFGGNLGGGGLFGSFGGSGLPRGGFLCGACSRLLTGSGFLGSAGSGGLAGLLFDATLGFGLARGLLGCLRCCTFGGSNLGGAGGRGFGCLRGGALGLDAGCFVLCRFGGLLCLSGLLGSGSGLRSGTTTFFKLGFTTGSLSAGGFFGSKACRFGLSRTFSLCHPSRFGGGMASGLFCGGLGTGGFFGSMAFRFGAGGFLSGLSLGFNAGSLLCCQSLCFNARGVFSGLTGSFRIRSGDAFSLFCCSAVRSFLVGSSLRHLIRRQRLLLTAIADDGLKPFVDLGGGFEQPLFELLEKRQGGSPHQFSLIYRLQRGDGRGCLIDKPALPSHLLRMRVIVVLMICMLAGPALAQAPQPMCSSSKWGHVHCIRAQHFVYDTCNAIKVFSERHGLNTDFFARLIWQESRFDPNALSPANARGIAQFIPSTAALRGLKDPYNPADALAHSAQYLAEMVQRFGNEGMAAIGYNGGERRAQGFLEGKGLARETVNYVPIITGLNAEDWRDGKPRVVDMRLSKETAFLPACYRMAQKRRITPLARPEPALAKWGVQLAFGTSRKSAQAAYTQRARACRGVIGKERPDYVNVKHRASGKKGYVMARLGRSTRKGADQLCAQLRRAGCICAVYANR